MATSTTLPIQETSSIYLPENQQMQNWLVIRVPPRTVHLRMEVFVLARITILARDPRFRSFTVSESPLCPPAPALTRFFLRLQQM